MFASDALFEVGTPLQWLPDETLFSLASRYHRLSGNRLASTTCRTLFGHPTQGSAHDLPSRISHFEQVTNGRLGSADEIVRRRTILPFYLPFASPDNGRAAVEALAGPSIGSLKFRLGMLTSRFRANHPLKACFDCMAEDRARCATPYWHLEHQLPGVWVCLKHGGLLGTSTLKATGVQRFGWLLPDGAHMQEAQETRRVSRALTSLAEASTELAIRFGHLHFEAATVCRTLRDALRSRGMISDGDQGRLRLQRIGREYAAFASDLRCVDELRALPSDEASAATEVGQLARSTYAGVHPLRRLAVVSWLFESFNDFVANYRAHADPASAADSENRDSSANPRGTSAKQQELLRLIADGESISGAARLLNVDPVTGMAWAAAAGVATQKRPKHLRGDVRSRMIAALRRGAGKAAVASIGDASIVSVTRLLRTEVGLHDQWRTARFQAAQRHARRRWLRVVTANPRSGVKAARVLQPAAYAWLYRNDQAWLKAQTDRMERVTGQPGPQLDWDARDRGIASEVRRVALEIATAAPGSKIKLWQLYQRLPQLKAKLDKLDRLPLTRNAIYESLRSTAPSDLISNSGSNSA